MFRPQWMMGGNSLSLFIFSIMSTRRSAEAEVSAKEQRMFPTFCTMSDVVQELRCIATGNI